MSKPTTPPPKLAVPVPIHIAEDPQAKAEFIRVVLLLGDKVDKRDVSLLADYAKVYSEIIDLRTDIGVEGRVLVGAKGGSYLNPLVNLLSGKESLIAQLRRDLYFTPKSRIEKQTKGNALTRTQNIRNTVDADEEE